MSSARDDHVAINQAAWDAKADEYRVYAERTWARSEISWGIWQIAEWARRWPSEEIWVAEKRA